MSDNKIKCLSCDGLFSREQMCSRLSHKRQLCSDCAKTIRAKERDALRERKRQQVAERNACQKLEREAKKAALVSSDTEVKPKKTGLSDGCKMLDVDLVLYDRNMQKQIDDECGI